MVSCGIIRCLFNRKGCSLLIRCSVKKDGHLRIIRNDEPGEVIYNIEIASDLNSNVFSGYDLIIIELRPDL